MWFLPVGNENPTRKFPTLTLSLIIANVLIFFATWHGGNYADLIDKYAFVPAQFSVMTLFTHQFLHGGYLHLVGNLAMLWIFGRNVEDLLGRIVYIPFYLACGVSAALMHMLVEFSRSGGDTPTIGASGAIFGILGAYFVLFPRSVILGRPVLFMMPLPIKLTVSAVFFLGLYIILEIINGMGALSTAGVRIAHWAHIGGFLFAAGFLFLLIATRAVIVPNIEKVRSGGYATMTKEDWFLGQLDAAQENGRYGALPDDYRSLLAKNPRIVFSPDIQIKVARGVRQAGDLPLSADAYKRLLESYPGHPTAHRAAIEMSRLAVDFFRDKAMARAYLDWVTKASGPGPIADEARALATQYGRIL